MQVQEKCVDTSRSVLEQSSHVFTDNQQTQHTTVYNFSEKIYLATIHGVDFMSEPAPAYGQGMYVESTTLDEIQLLTIGHNTHSDPLVTFHGFQLGKKVGTFGTEREPDKTKQRKFKDDCPVWSNNIRRGDLPNAAIWKRNDLQTGIGSAEWQGMEVVLIVFLRKTPDHDDAGLGMQFSKEEMMKLYGTGPGVGFYFGKVVHVESNHVLVDYNSFKGCSGGVVVCITPGDHFLKPVALHKCAWDPTVFPCTGVDTLARLNVAHVFT
eukprot:TRINITY_DN66780_c2_g9_i1.p1 TRINITY_DN66780_c2_g9~~TRINITY_DN66780_c2_g9_i1.p1  ORF type:complete len:305 (-),score=29.19 TRINITY_DN66780_c2_g9_i1:55-852(-)